MSAMEISLVVCCMAQFLILLAVLRIGRDERNAARESAESLTKRVLWQTDELARWKRWASVDEQTVQMVTRQYAEVRQLSFMYSYGIHQNVTRLHEAHLALVGSRPVDALDLVRAAHNETLALLMTDPEKWGKPAPGTVN